MKNRSTDELTGEEGVGVGCKGEDVSDELGRDEIESGHRSADSRDLRLAVDEEEDETKPELLYVLNLVRTKLDKTVRRYVTCCWTVT